MILIYNSFMPQIKAIGLIYNASGTFFVATVRRSAKISNVCNFILECGTFSQLCSNFTLECGTACKYTRKSMLTMHWWSNLMGYLCRVIFEYT